MEVTINGKTCVGTLEECTQFINIMKNSIDESDVYVDLDLPSGTLWAKCNIGAEKETECGKYFMWGDIIGRYEQEILEKPCNWETVPFGEDDIDRIKNMVCPNNVLAKMYDSVYIQTSGKACMPTKEQFAELIENTFATWEDNFNGSGVHGIRLMSKINPSKYIFIPSSYTAYCGTIVHMGSDGSLWTSNLKSSNTNTAWYIYLYNNKINIDKAFRNEGHCVRGVISQQ